MREYLLQQLKKACDQYQLSPDVFFSSVALMDFFMDNHSIEASHLDIVPLTALCLQAKVDEKDRNIPKPTEVIVKCAPSRLSPYTLDEYEYMERMFINLFQWRFLYPTPHTFVRYFMQYLINDEEIKKIGWTYDVSLSDLKKEIEAIIESLLFKITENIQFYDYKSSEIAASIIYVTRGILKFPKIWTHELRVVTCYTEEQIKNCTDYLLSIYDTSANQKNEGFGDSLDPADDCSYEIYSDSVHTSVGTKRKLKNGRNENDSGFGYSSDGTLSPSPCSSSSAITDLSLPD